MKTKVSYQQIVDRLTEVLADEVLANEYYQNAITHQGICGWCGVMSPLTRRAFLIEFGSDVVEKAEQEAMANIAAKNSEYKKTFYFQHSITANENQQAGNTLVDGSYYWGYCSGLKHDGCESVVDEIQMYEKYRDEYSSMKKPVLFHIRRIIEATEQQFTDGRWLVELIADDKELQRTGGTRNEDLPADYNPYNLTKEQIATCYTTGFAVVAPDGRWFLVDTEGYDYPRYIYITTDYEKMLSNETNEARQRTARAKEEREAKEAAEKAERRAAYEERCQKWRHLMQDVRPLHETRTKCKEYRSQERKDADRAIITAQRRNILAMVQAAFPGQKFTLRRNHGWGYDWELTWIDGPTRSEFDEDTDLDLFCGVYDTFDGMTDCAGSKCMEFTDFAEMAIGDLYSGNIRAIRQRGKENNSDRWEETSFYTRPQETETKKVEETRVSTEGLTLKIIEYSERAFAVIGDTKAVKEILKEFGGRWNAKLSCGAGWIFSSAKTDRAALSVALGI